MISITATGFIGEKPQLVMVGQSAQKCEFDVIWTRKSKHAGEWKTHWERATFVSWGDEAEQIASFVEKGNIVTCVGTQETSEWMDKATQQRRTKVKYKLLSWSKMHIPRPQQNDSEQAQHPQQRQAPSGPFAQQQGSRQPATGSYHAPRNHQPAQQPRQPVVQPQQGGHTGYDEHGFQEYESSYAANDQDNGRMSGHGSDFIDM